MPKNPILINMLAAKAGQDVSTPSGAEYLRNDIESATGESLGLNTVKRIVGLIEYEGTHRPVIMDIIARYLGYESWEILDAFLQDRISFFSSASSVLNLEDLPPHQRVEIAWDPDRRIIVEHTEGKKYKVVESINSKLRSGDLLSLSQIAPGFPFYVSEVIREGNSMGTYTAATINGITNVSLCQ